MWIMLVIQPLRSEQGIRAEQVDNPEEPLLSDDASDSLAALQPTPSRTFTDKDVPVFFRVTTPLLLAALLIFQSVVPCCAISKLLVGGDCSETLATPVSHTCSCCPHSQPQEESVPSDDDHSPNGKCPYCGGLLFHSGLDDATPLPEGQLVFVLLGDLPEHANGQAPTFRQTLQRQVLGQPFLNTGTRLLI